MKDIDKLAAEAWKQIVARGAKYEAGLRSGYDEDCIAIIKSATEKTTKVLRGDLEVAQAMNRKLLSRAAHALDKNTRMKDTDQIAAESADRIFTHVEERRKWLSATDPIIYKHVLIDIIKSAVEKAYKQGGEDVITGAVVTDAILDNPGDGAARASEQARKEGDPSEHEFRFDVCQKCGVSAFNLDENEPCFSAAHASEQGSDESRTKTLLRSMLAALDRDDGDTFFKCYEMFNNVMLAALSQRPTKP